MRSSTSFHPGESRCRGLTIIELLVVVVILGIVAAIAAPNLSTWMESYTVRKSGRQLISDLRIPPLAAYGLNQTSVMEIVERAAQASSMKANPIVLTREELTATLEAAI